MSTVTLIIISLFFLVLLAAIFIMFNKLKQIQTQSHAQTPNDKLFLMLQNQIQTLNQTMDHKIGESTKSMSESQQHMQRTIQSQFGQSAKIIGEVTEKLAKLDETNKQVVGFAEQLQSLENILKNPKQRGILGEYYLETLLKNVMPPSAYQMQYKFDDGTIVDAAVFIKDKIVPIDSKFSLENYNRIIQEKNEDAKIDLQKKFKQDLKLRIDETSKYIKPTQGTMDFAFMFIPSEGIYYDLLVNQIGAIKVNTNDLIEYAFKEKKVIIVSPTSFFAYLQTVLQGLRALQIEEGAKEIRKHVEKLGNHLRSYEEYMKKVGKNLSTTVNMYNSASKEFGKIDKDIVKIAGTERFVEVEHLDKPQLDI